ncbi:unnamed protein product (macronuclear) [Paramecium tetraurelia]|uniref:RRM domain-containing protein n=1 Tax=Paramecium tetraurelia TaxID=5888 RepID=A0DLH3_PARTE|nr:uncharacterized protein GSPATT00018207001 [Paramecium tetraurelia]CAK83890.1 unnamed protein product [Paramecium tetraurelia]|eukprot:XP_001451287.1 hypothetical protein (macronuclear) [Paramecium tetraurelia strain d4-2]
MQQVFISGLPYTASENDVQTLFEECGEILSIKLPRYQDSNRLLGYGHITFNDSDAIQKALALNGSQLGGRYIDVKEAKGTQSQKPSVPPPECHTIFVKNLSYDLNADQIGDSFRPCGKVANVRMVYNTVTDNFKGFAYIDFEDHQSVIKALQMNGKKVHGRQVQVDFDIKKPKAGFRYSTKQVEQQNKYNQEYQEIQKKKIKKEKAVQKVKKIKNFAETQKQISAQRNKQQI